MKASKTDFDYGSSVSRFAMQHYFDSFKKESGNGPDRYHMTETEKHSLKEIKETLELEISTLAKGISSIGYLLTLVGNDRAEGHDPPASLIPQAIMQAFDSIDSFSRALKYMQSAIIKG